jgi:hypothetical protein
MRENRIPLVENPSHNVPKKMVHALEVVSDFQPAAIRQLVDGLNAG